MVDLFRYIEQAFVVPTASTAIDVSQASDFQQALQKDITDKTDSALIKKQATDFIAAHFTLTDTSAIGWGNKYLALRQKVLGTDKPSIDSLNQAVQDIFGMDLQAVISSDQWRADKSLINDTAIATKLVTGFNLLDMASLMSMRQVIAFLEDLSAGTLSVITASSILTSLSRPLRIPTPFLTLANIAQTTTPVVPPQPPAPPDPAASQAQAALKTAYDQMMSIEPSSMEIKSAKPKPYVKSQEASMAVKNEQRIQEPAAMHSIDATITLSHAAIQQLDQGVQETIKKQGIDLTTVSLTTAVSTIKKQWLNLARQTRPASLPQPLKVYRLGVHLFTLPATTTIESAPAPIPMTAFSSVVTRPVGIGNLQVVRQELLGYEAGDISHIENVLEGELLRRNTMRKEINELTLDDETETSQTQERDQQSTQRNELATETQKESGQQSSSSQGQTSSSDYGKLVENSKSNYAQSVTNKAVNTLTQMVKQQRIQREKKTFREKADHELDNTKGSSKIRGIYQWVDKKYKTRVMNYGKRLLYDVVVPEPAAFLIDSLKNATQAENFQLIKPSDPGITPSDLNAGNYMWYASSYGVTSAVTPPPDDFLQTIVHTDSPAATSPAISVFGNNINGNYFAAFTLQIPENYKAVSGFIQNINCSYFAPPPGRFYEFYVGEKYYFRFGPSDIVTLNKSFTMNSETGQLAVTLRTFGQVTQIGYAIGINCQRTDKLMEQWQLKTHAAITAGYQRQYADYLDKLTQYKSSIRSQLATVQNYDHDTTVATQELKKAFIHLLMSEHFGKVYIPTPDPNALPTDPVLVKNWGAVVAFFERAFEWENIMYTYYPYFWGRSVNWQELLLIQDVDPDFEAFLKAGACRLVIPARPGFEAALAHYQETGDIWMGEEMPDMFSDLYVSIIDEIKAANYAPGTEICVAQWDVTLPTTLVLLKDDATLPEWTSTVDCSGATA
jgi:hypothetical protein